MLFEYLKAKTKQYYHSKLANLATHIYFASPNNIVGDFFYRLHQKHNFKAHTARVSAEELNGKINA